MRRFIYLFILFPFAALVGQIAVTNAVPFDDEAYLVNSVLVGGDLNTSSFSSVGFANGIGYFDGFLSNIGFDEGVILSSGGLELVTNGFGNGSGISGDSDLELALTEINLTWGVNNVTILEFDFVAESESVAFNYVFGSVEYTSYTCSVFNDIFGFFLSGPGIAGPYSNNAINLAYIPDPDNPGQYTTTPVAVNTVNSGVPSGFSDADCENIDPNWEDYNIYWVDNDYTGTAWDGVNQPPSPEFTVEGITGFTTPLTAEYNNLICGETYHIKLAIADASDGALNSVVFLEANSFISPSVVVNPLSNITGPILEEDPLAIYEGCAAAQLEFTATANSTEDILLEVLFEGNAVYGTDFVVSYNGGDILDPCINNDGEEALCVTIPAGQEVMYLDLQAIYDEDDSEEIENIQITINAIAGLCQQAELAVSEITFNLYDQIEIVVESELETIECFGDVVTLVPVSVIGGYIGETNNYTYQWVDQNGTILGSEESLQVSTSADAIYTLSVMDNCQDQEVFSLFNVEVNEYSEINISFPDYLVCDEDVITINPNLIGGSGDYSYVWPDSSTPCDCESYDLDYELDLGADQVVELQVIDNCSAAVYDFEIPVGLSETQPPSVSIMSIGVQFCPNDEITLESQIQGESNYSYSWLNLDLDEYEFSNGQSALVSPVVNTIYDLLVIDECNGEEYFFDYNAEVPAYAPPTFTIVDMGGCVGQEIELTVQDLFAEGVIDSEDDSQYNFLWSTGETTQAINAIVQESPTYYSVQVSDLCGNTSNDQSLELSPSSPPPPAFTLDQIDQNTIQFTQLTEGFFTQFNWDFGDGNTSTEYEPIHIYDTEGDYYVSLVASDDLGCENSYNGLVNIYPSLLFYSPDVFSPNGDGVNDLFKVSVSGYEDFELFIFDRWGKALFSTTDPNEGWDGTYPSGAEVPQDVYMYKAYMTNSGAGEKLEKGRVSIVK
jgi:gliding motility-associated-like protein